METYRNALDVIGNFLYGVNPPFDGSNLNSTIALVIFFAATMGVLLLKLHPSKLYLMTLIFSFIFGFGAVLGIPLRQEMKFSQCETRELSIDDQTVNLRYCRYRETLDSNYGSWKIVVPNR